MAYKKSEETREGIVTTARRLFAEKGYEHTDMKEIAVEMGMTHAALYYYFKNKVDVAWEIYRVETEGVLAEVERVQKEQQPTPLFLCIFQYVLIIHRLAFNPVTESYFFDEINYRGYDKGEMQRVRRSYYAALEALFEEQGVHMDDDQFAAFILTSDAYAKALLCAIKNQVIGYTWKEALDHFFRHLILTDLDVSFEEYAETRDAVFAYLQY
ncbi:MAG: TetR/AcrR family transcriptional regulator [Firmicutes bacterium]|nr:TetR/AcrR family transcriptional regulator [Bacillota bacterium]